MSDAPASNDASMSSYKYWRSRYKGSGDGAEQPRSAEKIVADAACNRLGEEIGQRLDRLIWPMIPNGLKHLTAVAGGRVMPLAWLYSTFLKQPGNRRRDAAIERFRRLGLDPMRVRMVVNSILSDPNWRETMIAAARERCPDGDEETLRSEANAILASRIAAELGIDGSLPVSLDDPKSVEQLLLIALIVNALNGHSMEAVDQTDPE